MFGRRVTSHNSTCCSGCHVCSNCTKVLLVQGQHLICSGFGYSNMLANINDGRADAMCLQPSDQDRPANVQLLPVAVGRWPFLFVVACDDIEPGGVLPCGTCKFESLTFYVILISLYPCCLMHIYGRRQARNMAEKASASCCFRQNTSCLA